MSKDGHFVEDDEYFSDGTVKVDWKEVTVSLDDTSGKLYVCGKTYAQSVAARDCYEWLEDNKVKPEPQPTNISKQDLDRFLLTEKRLLGDKTK